MTTAVDVYDSDDPDEARLVHLVGTRRFDRSPRGADKPVVYREIHETPDGHRHIREIDYPEGQ